ncbi:MAG: DUF2520 domain-containing protein, partial [Myxococcota bacterium]
MKVVIVGRGRVGKGLSAALRASDLEVSLRSGRTTLRGIDPDVVVLAVPDAAIADVAARIAPATSKACVFLHCAGSLGPAAFGAIDRPGGAMHPLVSFANPSKP